MKSIPTELSQGQPVNMLRLLSGIKTTLNSSSNSAFLSRSTGVSRSYLYRLRKGQRNILRASMRTCIRLASYPDRTIMEYYEDSIGKMVDDVLHGENLNGLYKALDTSRNSLYKFVEHYHGMEGMRLKIVLKLAKYWKSTKDSMDYY